jgi:hypothetical protein
MIYIDFPDLYDYMKVYLRFNRFNRVAGGRKRLGSANSQNMCLPND